MGAGPRVNGHNGAAREEDQLEQVVDVHAFTPAALAAHARGAGLDEVRVSGEELAASLFGWANRALEATAAPDEIPYAWRHVRLPRLPPAAGAGPLAARAAPAGGDVLQPADLGQSPA